jgi:hypothetical protein
MGSMGLLFLSGSHAKGADAPEQIRPAPHDIGEVMVQVVVARVLVERAPGLGDRGVD